MDPVGPWSAYAPYNRLAGVQAATSDLHHHLAASGNSAVAGGAGTSVPSTTAAQILPGTFLTPPPVGYETVFSPLFHPAGTKPTPAHYVAQVAQQRQAAAVAAKQAGAESEYHQPQNFFDQATASWQQNGPFGILPHEVVPTTSTKSSSYDNLNAHIAAAQTLNHLNSQLVANTVSKNSPARTQSPSQLAANNSPNKPTTVNNFFQTSNLQSCIVSTPNLSLTTVPIRAGQQPARSTFTNVNRPVEKIFQPPISKQPTVLQIQTKPQTKIYADLTNQQERIQQQQQQHSNYTRHYQQQSGNKNTPISSPNTSSEYSSTNGSNCNVVVPRRPSPLQAHSQPSPIGHAPSPAYPMYNSPMNSISSPQHNNSNQVTPPLDVSVPRVNPQGTVAYPSVITRALNNSVVVEKIYNSQSQQQPQQNQTCWDDRQQRKFPNNQNNNNNYNQGNQQGLDISQNKSYFDGHQVTLQDLSSCRGDPMTIVKNLQQQQQAFQVQPTVEIKQEVKPPPNKRRKSNATAGNNEKECNQPPMEWRIPPPAHTSTNIVGANQQQQNGSTYFDFDRWNLPPPPTKIFTPHHQQHQPLMVPHPPPPLPYFPPFLAPHPSSTQDYSQVELQNQQFNSDIQQYPQQQPLLQQEDEQPKVVVPNIEEELNFLSHVPSVPKVENNRVVPIVPNKVDSKSNGPGAGFMNSYLKFLQGDRDSSPPPPSRGGNRKQATWSRQGNKPDNMVQKTMINGVSHTNSANNLINPVSAINSMNSVNSMNLINPVSSINTLNTLKTKSSNNPTSSTMQKLSSQGDPQDDPRYFPLPKERKKNRFDSSDDGISSDDDLFPKKMSVPQQLQQDKQKEKKSVGGKKGRPSKLAMERKNPSNIKSNKVGKTQKNNNGTIIGENLGLVQKRELSKRAAKEKSKTKQYFERTEDDDPPEFVDSDSDPAWTPQAKEEEDDLEPVFNKKKGKSKAAPNVPRKKRKNLISAAIQGAGIGESDGYSDNLQARNKQNRQKYPSGVPTILDNISGSHGIVSNILDDVLFKIGDFVAIKSELLQEWPAIWKVDGKNLLQKYEPFDQNGSTCYRNISTYTSWTTESKKQYVTVPIRYKSQSHLENVVEFLRYEMSYVNNEFMDIAIKSYHGYQDNFEVYIQTLISQALDSNFLTEIFQEQDEYFLTNVKTIDEITAAKTTKLQHLLRWPQSIQIALSTWPCFNVIPFNANELQMRNCAACQQPSLSNIVRLSLYGQPYNPTTLEGGQPNPQAINNKEILMCRICAIKVDLYNKVAHQKYLMYIECAKKVQEKRTSDPNKDTTCILNELLADEQWLTQLFFDVRSSWAEADGLQHSYQLKSHRYQDQQQFQQQNQHQQLQQHMQLVQ